MEDTDETTLNIQPTSDALPVADEWEEKLHVEDVLKQSLSTPIMDPQQKATAKQLIEKHTIENVQLESNLQDEEAASIKRVLVEFERKKDGAMEEAMAELTLRLSQVGLNVCIVCTPPNE